MLSRIRQYISNIVASATLSWSSPSESGFRESYRRNNSKPFYGRLVRRNRTRPKLALDAWRAAVEMAEQVDNPRREPLYDIYAQALTDETLLSEIRKARILVQRAPFVVQRKKKDDDELTELFERPWFLDLMEFFLDAELWGHSLVELSDMRDGEFTAVNLIDREHVRPEYMEVAYDRADVRGMPIDDIIKQFNAKLLFLGGKGLGLLKVASKSVILKNYSESDWSRYNEKYGMPIRVIKTTSRDDQEIEKMHDTLRDIGSDGYGVVDDGDELMLIERNQAQGYMTYRHFIDDKKNDLIKLINGQTGTSDEKAYVGGAEVHERILNDYTFERLTRLEMYINQTLIPFLADNGYPLKPKRDKFRFVELMKKKKEDEATTPAPDNNAQKKKPQLSKLTQLSFDPTDNTEGCCNHHPPSATLMLDLSSLYDRALQRVYDKKTKAGEIDAATWKANADELMKAVDEGYGTAYKDALDAATANQLRFNVAVFAAFKNHAQNVELAAALVDDAGKLKTWEQFKADAAALIGQYNDTWLKAEYQTAVAAAQMAAQWQDIQRDKDLYPNLRYVTVGDEKVRKAHAALDGVTLPVDDDFWLEWLPPNGWNCRCSVQQVGANARLKSANTLPDDKQSPPLFRNNAGATMRVFNEQHPYYNVDRQKASAAVKDFVQKEIVQKDVYQTAFSYKNGGKVDVHLVQNGDELAYNIRTAQAIAQAEGAHVKLLPYSTAKGVKNAEATIDGQLADFKAASSPNAVQNAIKRAATQNAKIAVVTFDGDFDAAQVARKLIAALGNPKWNSSIEQVWILRGSKLQKVKRADVQARRFKLS